MRYGMSLPNFGAFADARLVAEVARDAEAAGWDGFYLWDHVSGRSSRWEIRGSSWRPWRWPPNVCGSGRW